MLKEIVFYAPLFKISDLSREIISSYILPILRLLEVDLKNVSPETLVILGPNITYPSMSIENTICFFFPLCILLIILAISSTCYQV